MSSSDRVPDHDSEPDAAAADDAAAAPPRLTDTAALRLLPRQYRSLAGGLIRIAAVLALIAAAAALLRYASPSARPGVRGADSPVAGESLAAAPTSAVGSPGAGRPSVAGAGEAGAGGAVPVGARIRVAVQVPVAGQRLVPGAEVRLRAAVTTRRGDPLRGAALSWRVMPAAGPGRHTGPVELAGSTPDLPGDLAPGAYLVAVTARWEGMAASDSCAVTVIPAPSA